MSHYQSGRGTVDASAYTAQLGIEVDQVAADQTAILDDDQLRSIRDTALRSAVHGRDARQHATFAGPMATEEVVRSLESLRAHLLDVRDTLRWSTWLQAGTVLAVGIAAWAAALFLGR